MSNNLPIDILRYCLTEMKQLANPAQTQLSNKKLIPYELSQTSESIIILAELPGFEQDSIGLDFFSDCLKISGTKKSPTNLATIKETTIKYGQYETNVKLPLRNTLDRDNITVVYEDGVLRIIIKFENQEESKIHLSVGDFQKHPYIHDLD